MLCLLCTAISPISESWRALQGPERSLIPHVSNPNSPSHPWVHLWVSGWSIGSPSSLANTHVPHRWFPTPQTPSPNLQSHSHVTPAISCFSALLIEPRLQPAWWPGLLLAHVTLWAPLAQEHTGDVSTHQCPRASNQGSHRNTAIPAFHPCKCPRPGCTSSELPALVEGVPAQCRMELDGL